MRQVGDPGRPPGSDLPRLEAAILFKRIVLALSLAAVSLPLVAGSTEHAGTSSPAATNRLAGARSPYLLLHADNPVDGYAASEGAERPV